MDDNHSETGERPFKTFLDAVVKCVCDTPLRFLPDPKAPTKSATPSPQDFDVRAAVASDAEKIRTWVQSPDEIKFIGSPSTTLDIAEIGKWISSSNPRGCTVGFVVDRKSSRQPVAFINIEILDRVDRISIEVGRLLVDRAHRNQGIGSSVAHHVFMCLAKVRASHTFPRGLRHLDRLAISARVVVGNNRGGRLVSRVGLSRGEIQINTLTNTDEQWYSYTPYRRPILASTLRDLCKAAEISEYDLAFKCGVARSTINLLLSGKRDPSLELLQLICNAIAPDDQYLRVQVLLAAIAEIPSPRLKAYETVFTSRAGKLQSLWVLTDEIAELQHSSFLHDTVAALSNGFSRYYFLPKGGWEGMGRQLHECLVNSKPKSVADQTYFQNLRIYEAPSSLCFLRIAVESPAEDKPGMITLAGQEGARIPLPEDIAGKFYRHLQEAILATSQGDITPYAPYAGFAQKWPSVSQTSRGVEVK